MRFSTHAPLAAFAVIAIATTYGLQQNANESTKKLIHSQHVACLRANELRSESNQRIRSHLILRDAAEDALISQEAARKATYKLTGHRSDQKAEHRARALIIRIRRDVKYHQTPLIDCSKQ